MNAGVESTPFDIGQTALLFRVVLYIGCFLLFAYCGLTVFRRYRFFAIAHSFVLVALLFSSSINYFLAALGLNAAIAQTAIAIVLVPALFLYLLSLVWLARQASGTNGTNIQDSNAHDSCDRN